MSGRTSACAVVMAGGRSTRMGKPKALLKIGGVTLIERVVSELRRSFQEVIVVAAPPQAAGFALPRLDATTIFDPIPFEGPLAALKLGLEAARGEQFFVCPCDAPGLRAQVGLALCAAVGDHDAAVPLIDGRPQPLTAAYHRRCYPTVRALLDSGERRLLALLPLLNVRSLNEDEMRRLDPGLDALLNLNTPEDYHAALRRARSMKSA